MSEKEFSMATSHVLAILSAGLAQKVKLSQDSTQRE